MQRKRPELFWESHLSSWQAIETAPKDGSDFIGMRRDGERLLTHTTRMALYSGHHLWECLEFDAVSPWSPTHWMPLPGIATVETKTEYAGFPVVEDPTVEPGTIEIRNPPPATTWAHGGENKCKHCGRSFLLHIAEDSYGRKDVCAPPKYGAVNTKTVRRKCCGCIDDEAHMCSECFCLCHTASSQV
jgi:hypothetical protein